MTQKYRTLDEIIQNEIRNPDDRDLYLSAAVEDFMETSDEKTLLLAIRQIVKAGMGFKKLSELTGLSRESLYKTLSVHGNPKLKTLKLILSALGYEFNIRKKQEPA